LIVFGNNLRHLATGQTTM